LRSIKRRRLPRKRPVHRIALDQHKWTTADYAVIELRPLAATKAQEAAMTRQAQSLQFPDVAPAGWPDVLDLCHRQTIYSLGKLAALVSRLAADGADAEAQALAAEVFEHFAVGLRRHHQDEEASVFPELLTHGDPLAARLVRRLRQDHAWLEEDWLELSPQLDAVANGQASFDVDLLREGSLIFSALLHDHIALEESVIYPSARARLEQAARAQPGRDLAARRRESRGPHDVPPSPAGAQHGA
jgi:hypothetical protein